MALLQKHRDTIYGRLSPVVGEEETQVLLDQFPSREQDEPVTKGVLDAALAKLSGELRTETAEMGSALRTETAEMGSALRTEIADLRTDFARLGGDVREQIATVHADISKQLYQHTVWVASACMGVAGFAATVLTMVIA